MVEGNRFEEVEKQFYAFMQLQDYNQALEYAQKTQQEYKDKHFKTSFWIAKLHCLNSNFDEAMDELKIALDLGSWWSPKLLIETDAFKELHKYQKFNSIIEECSIREKEELLKTKPELLVIKPTSRREIYPTIFSIHWRIGNALSFSRYWRSKEIEKDYQLAFPQSSQICMTGEYFWDNLYLAEMEALYLYNQLEFYQIDKEHILLAGASQGAKLAIDLALNGKIHTKGLILVIPAIKDAMQYIPLLKKARTLQLKVLIFTGTLDPFFQETEALHELFNQYQVASIIDITEGMGHRFPDNFSKKLSKYLSFFEG